jgi:hypothetical protein
MSLFDIIKYPFPDPLNMEYLNTIPPEVYLQYRVWLHKHNEYAGITYEERKACILDLLYKYEKGPIHDD